MSQETTRAKLETWAIVELMGHKVMAGHVEEVEIAGQGFIRLDVPAVEGQQQFTKLLNPSAIYAVTPTDEPTAMRAAGALREKPIHHYALQAAALTAGDDEGELIDAEFSDDDGDRCEGCGDPATIQDSEGVPLCNKCVQVIITPAEEPPVPF